MPFIHAREIAALKVRAQRAEERAADAEERAQRAEAKLEDLAAGLAKPDELPDDDDEPAPAWPGAQHRRFVGFDD